MQIGILTKIIQNDLQWLHEGPDSSLYRRSVTQRIIVNIFVVLLVMTKTAISHRILAKAANIRDSFGYSYT